MARRGRKPRVKSESLEDVKEILDDVVEAIDSTEHLVQAQEEREVVKKVIKNTHPRMQKFN